MGGWLRNQPPLWISPNLINSLQVSVGFLRRMTVYGSTFLPYTVSSITYKKPMEILRNYFGKVHLIIFRISS